MPPNKNYQWFHFRLFFTNVHPSPSLLFILLFLEFFPINCMYGPQIMKQIDFGHQTLIYYNFLLKFSKLFQSNFTIIFIDKY